MKDLSQTQPSMTSTPAAPSNESPDPNADPAAKPAEPKPAPAVPETYSFKASDGRELDQSLVAKATPIFKELGLSEAQAQKLVDTYNDLTKSEGERLDKVVNDMRAEWREGINKDKDMSGKLETIKADLGRMKDTIFANKPADREAFEAAMNLTGAGDHPAIVKAWWRASEAFREGQHVSGGGASPHGQTAPGADTRPSVAAAMYPNLTRSH